jgi:hypothetical protein
VSSLPLFRYPSVSCLKRFLGRRARSPSAL